MFKQRSKVRTKKKLHRRVIDPGKLMLVRQFFIGLTVLFFTAAAVTGLWYGTRVQSLTITTITVEGGETISHAQVRAQAEATLQGAYLRFIPRRFAWWYPQTALLNAVKAIPRIKNPVVTRVSGTEIHISFQEYLPYALWCAIKEPSTCLFIDDSGLAFGNAPVLSGGAFIRYHSLEQTPAIGASILPASQLANIAQFIQLLKASSAYSVSVVEVDSAGDVFYELAGGSEFKASLAVPATSTFANLESVLMAKEFHNLQPGNFQYIDLRFGNKVYVNDNPPSGATSTTADTLFSTSTATVLTDTSTTTP